MSPAAESSAARRAYEAYVQVVGDKAYAGHGDLSDPTWDTLGSTEQKAWRAAATEGQRAYAEQDQAQATSAARQLVDREGEYGATTRLAQQFITVTYAKLIAEGEVTSDELETWEEMSEDDRQYLREVFAELIRGGHLHAGRNTDLPDLQERLDEAEGLISGLLAVIDAPRLTHTISLATSWRHRYLDDLVRLNGRCLNCLELTAQCKCEKLATADDAVTIEVSEDSDRN